ncbi:KH domain-containing protein [Tremella mesenterica]|uniref:KH domain-containing protein n=1 Tax=Tremella mesenterica TaxID=5217 RepID=A0A4Q1BBX8_TREME|nr:KH domain-containing protein [Tremella mesenterica]
MDSSRKSRWDTSDPSASSAGPANAVNTADAAAQAAAIAAKIAASLRPGAGSLGTELIRREEAGGFTHDIDINDLRNRYLLTKGTTQKEIADATGASIVTKGVWVPDTAHLQPGETPLYLHISATSKTMLDDAVKRVRDLIDQDLGPLIDDRTLVARNRALGLPLPATVLPNGRPKWPEDKLYIGLDSLRNFNIRAKTVGPQGMFVKYIQAETGARVQIKGLGSGFLEQDTGREAEEPMHINIAAPTQEQVERAKVLSEDLLAVLRVEYAKARDGPGQEGVYQQGYGTYAAPGQDPYAGYYGQQGTPAQGQEGTPTQPGATPAPGGPPQQGSEAWQQYAAYWAAYGYDVLDPQCM